MKIKRHHVKLAYAICFFLAAVFTSSAFAAPPAGPPIKIGVVAGTSGPFAYESAAIVDGVKLAVKEFNQAGGVLGRPIEVTVIDDRFKPDEGVSGVRRLADEGYKFIIGGVSSDIGLAENVVVKEKNLVMFHPVAVDPRVSAESVAFDLHQNVQKLLETSPRLAVQYHKSKTVAMLIENGVTGRRGMDINNRVWASEGVKVVAAEFYDMGSIEFRPVLTSIKSKNPDLLYVMCPSAPTVAQIIKQAREIGLNVPIDLGFTLVSQDIPDLAGKAAEGVTALTMWFPGENTPESNRFTQAFRKEYGRDPRLWPSVTGYEAVNYILRGVQIAGTDSDTAKIKQGILAVQWVGPTGRKGGLDPHTGRPKESVYIRVGVKNGTWVLF